MRLCKASSPGCPAGQQPIAADIRDTAADIRDTAAAGSPDVILVDCMVPVGLPAARASGARVVLVMHTLYGYWDTQWSPGRRWDPGSGRREPPRRARKRVPI